jgi:hypothetical protein
MFQPRKRKIQHEKQKQAALTLNKPATGRITDRVEVKLDLTSDQ